MIGGFGWTGTALAFLAVTGRLLRPEWQNVWYWCAIGGLICISLYLLAHWREAIRIFSSRQTRYGSMAALSIAAVLGILVSVNYIAARQNWRWDLTAARQFTLSDQTTRVLEALDVPMSILVFGRDDDFGRFRSRFVEYEDVSPQVSVRYIDIDKKPGEARSYQIQSYGTVVFEYGTRIERVIADTEQELTNAMIRVVEGKSRTVYFLEGHGEKIVTSAARDGYNAVTRALEGDNFTVESTWAIELSSDVVVDMSAMGQLLGTDASMPVAANYPSHPITERFSFLTAFPLARSVVAIADGVDGRVAQPFVETSARSWAISDIARLTGSGEIELDEAQGDRPGPVVIGLAVAAPVDRTSEPAETMGPDAGERAADVLPADSKTEADAIATETRVAVIGDSDFAANFGLGIQGNRDLFLNTVNWLAQQETLVAIRAREPEDRRITLTAGQQQRNFWLSLLFLPGVVLGAGIYTWWQRRA